MNPAPSTRQPHSLESVLQRILLLLLFLPLLALILFFQGIAAFRNVQALQDQQLQLAHSLAYSVEEYLNTAGRMLRLPAILGDIHTQEDLRLHLSGIRQAYEYFDAIYVLGADGKIITVVPDDPQQIGLDMSRQPYFYPHVAGEIAISAPFLSPRSGQPTVYLTTPIAPCPADCPWHDGLLVGELNLGALENAIAAAAPTEGQQFAYIADRAGTLLAHPNHDWVAQQVNVGNLEIIHRDGEGDDTAIYAENGEFMFASAAALQSAPWVVVVQRPAAEVVRPFWTASAYMLGITVLVALLLLWRIRVRLRQFAIAPLSRLGQGADALAAGDFARGEMLVQHAGGYTEIHTLADDFVRMSQAIQTRQAALRESEHKLRGLFDQSYHFIGLLKPDGVVMEINATALAFVGRSQADVAGQPFSDTAWWTHDADLQARLNDAIRRSAAGKIIRFEATHCNTAGETYTFDFSLKPLLNDAGEVVMLIAEGRDITARKQMEEALRASEERLNAIIEKMPAVAIQGYDRQGKVLFWNHASETIYGWSERETLGKTLDELIYTPAAAAAFREDLKTIASTGCAIGPLEIEFTRKNGSRGAGSSTLFAIPAVSGEPIFICADVDITEQKRLETERDHRLAELEVINRVSSTLRAAETLTAMLACLLDETLSIIGSEAGAILLHDAASNRLNFQVKRGWFEQKTWTDIRPGEGISGQVFTRGEIFVTAEFASEPSLLAENRTLIPAGWGGACVPIRAAQDVVGVLFVAVPLPRRITSDEVRLASTLAEIAGSAVHRTRLHEKTEQQLQRLAALRAIDSAITSISDLRVILTVLLEQVLAQLGVDAAGIYLYNAQLHMLDFSAGLGFRHARLHSQVALGKGLAGRAAFDRRLLIQPNLSNAGRVSDWPHANEDFVAYAGAPLLAKGQVVGVLEVYHRSPLDLNQDWLNFLESFAGQAAIAVDNARLFESLQNTNIELALAYDATIEGWSRALDLRDRETEGHTQRVTEMTTNLARRMGVSEADLVHIRRGALLHDIGKMGVPDHILHKPGPLTDTEWEIMHRHPRLAFDMLASVTFLRPALDIPYGHHEKWDGSGYPRQLKGEQIPLAARIFAIVDVWDALRSDRPYRPAWDIERTIDHIRQQSGIHFDPRVVDAFLRMQQRM